MLPLMFAGMGSQVVGMGLNAYGQAIGADAIADARSRQLAEQEALQQQANESMSRAIAQQHVVPVGNVLGEKNALLYAKMATPTASAPMASALNYRQQQIVGANDSANQLANKRAVAVQANEQADLQDKARRLAALYQMELHNAGNAGIGFREAGNILQQLGTTAQGVSMMIPDSKTKRSPKPSNWQDNGINPQSNSYIDPTEAIA